MVPRSDLAFGVGQSSGELLEGAESIVVLPKIAPKADLEERRKAVNAQINGSTYQGHDDSVLRSSFQVSCASNAVCNNWR